MTAERTFTRIFVEKKPGYDLEAQRLCAELRRTLPAHGLRSLRMLLRYDVEGLSAEALEAARWTVFADPCMDAVYGEKPPPLSGRVFAVEYPPGQYDRRADGTAQCLQLLAQERRPVVECATLYALEGDVDDALFHRVRQRITGEAAASTPFLQEAAETKEKDDPAPPLPDAEVEQFTRLSPGALLPVAKRLGIAMSKKNLVFCQAYFRDQAKREPSLAELRFLAARWAARREAFHTALAEVSVAPSPYAAPVSRAWQRCLEAYAAIHGAGGKAISLGDVANLGNRALHAEGADADSIAVDARVDGARAPWRVRFHSEIASPPPGDQAAGGAAASLSGAMRGLLPGQAWAYQAMRVDVCGDPREQWDRDGASYGNRAGVATGKVQAIAHPAFAASPLVLNAVVAAAPAGDPGPGGPEPGDPVLLVGGRADCGGNGAQDGDPVRGRSLQRLFQNPDFTRRVKGCAALGAEGACAAVCALAPGVEIHLDALPNGCEGPDGAGPAAPEQREALVCVVAARDVAQMIRLAAQENLACALIAMVIGEPRLRMRRQGRMIADIARDFLDTGGVVRHAKARVGAPDGEFPYPLRLPGAIRAGARDAKLEECWLRVLGDPNVCGQRGLVERFDGSVGAGTVTAPCGGLYCGTPGEAAAALLPVPGATTTMTLLAHGSDPALAEWSPFHGAAYAVVEAISKVVAAGGDAAACRLMLRSRFSCAGGDAVGWGTALASILGALDAQLGMAAPAVSTGSVFGEGTEQPALVAFAVATEDVLRAVTPEFKGPGHALARLPVPRDGALLPDYPALRAAYDAIHMAMRKHQVLAVHTVGHGGVAAAVTRMAFGNRVGVALDIPVGLPARGINRKVAAQQDILDFLFLPDWGGLVLELADGGAERLTGGVNAVPGLAVIGRTQEEPVIQCEGMRLTLADAQAAWEAPLSAAFPCQAPAHAHGAPPPPPLAPHALRERAKAHVRTARPRVCIPCFPGTNGELDGARAFERAGATAGIVLFQNGKGHALDEAVRALAQGIGRAQILMLPGGFSAADEPDGAGKFIAAALRIPRIAEAIADLLEKRDGLILGIGNGFQGLLKTGLLPHGALRPPDEQGPVLTRNTLARHVSAYVHTVVSSVKSPWMAGVQPGAVHAVAVSHGEGRFVCGEAVLKALQREGQIAFQYCEPDGTPTMRMPHNPNGSAWAVEGICSPDGRILGKMGHSERAGPGVAVNIPGDKDQKLFASGVAYFA